jgi:hypothetical protein
MNAVVRYNKITIFKDIENYVENNWNYLIFVI